MFQPIAPVTVADFALSLNPNEPDRYASLWLAVYIPSFFFFDICFGSFSHRWIQLAYEYRQ
jgi:hypothetical protein